MKKNKILLIIIIPIVFLNACNTVKDGFRSQKKDSIDEFLVEKKSPLVMPPDFDELPLPSDTNENPEQVEESNIKSLISNNENSLADTESNVNQSQNFENSILEKIKKN
ncbi:DUF3035 domain-containing protein [Candidatus Pelagibacter sp. HIMB1483]|uniref:DUF3035 domain-containing protein n=1 Tax=Candidatus Pelagibacter sp. HIMB1483 TaxID=3415414 RepID=UPI003F837153